MSDVEDDVDALRRQIAQLETRLGDLKRRLSAAENAGISEPSQGSKSWKWPLEAEEYRRYGRQMIMPEVGLQGSSWLRTCKRKWLIGLCARTAEPEEGFRADRWRGRSGLPRCSVSCRCWSRNPRSG